LPNVSDNNNTTFNEYTLENNFPITNKQNIKWLNEPFQSLTLKLDELENEVHPKSMTSTIDYFNQYFQDDFFNNITFNTTLYTVQNSKFYYFYIKVLKIGFYY
jgi:hypothetical protein